MNVASEATPGIKKTALRITLQRIAKKSWKQQHSVLDCWQNVLYTTCRITDTSESDHNRYNGLHYVEECQFPRELGKILMVWFLYSYFISKFIDLTVILERTVHRPWKNESNMRLSCHSIHLRCGFLNVPDCNTYENCGEQYITLYEAAFWVNLCVFFSSCIWGCVACCAEKVFCCCGAL